MNKTYFDNHEKKLCNGCGTCKLLCPKKCIEMIEDEEGFFYPKVDESKCIHCNICKINCSNYNNKEKDNVKAYAVINKSKEYLEIRSSGGMFLLLAEYVINKGGIVFGAMYTDSLEVVHDYAENLQDAIKFSGSKYVRSNIDGSYEKVKKFLKNDRYVLYTGTSCQINGLKKYLGKNYDKLILCDIICHANPSPKVFKMFIKNLENKKNKKITKINFRGKESGWKEKNTIVQYEDGEKQIENSFMKAFGSELINRPSCSICPFASKERISDFTIGDFWGINMITPIFEKNTEGISLVLVNTSKALIIFNDLKDKMLYQEVNYDKASKYNHFENIPENLYRNKFFKMIKSKKITENNIINEINKYVKPNILKNIYWKIRKNIKSKKNF